MFFHTYKPAPPLSDFVDAIWYYEGEQTPHSKERILPDGQMQLLIDLREDRLRVYDGEQPHSFENLSGIMLSGVYSEHFVISTACQAKIMGVSFKQGGAFPFFTPPASELANIHVPLDALWRDVADELRERLLGAPSILSRFRLIESYLLLQAVRPLMPHPAIAFALGEFQRSPRRTIADVIDRTGFSSRRFIQLFSAEVGLTPKVFCRILRFREALQRLYQGEQIELVDLAVACGYYDQAHFSNDFKTFAGFSPTTYLAHRGPYINHIPLPE
jgi:AraC-like DNA-binding protein